MNAVIKYELSLPVTVRKHELDTEALRNLLRSSKKESGLSNRKISELINRPITEVEHWFRTDACFSVPDPQIWYELKDILEISTEIFDAPVTEFVEKPGIFEKANRFYDVDGIAPTLTSASANEKIIINGDYFKEGDEMLTKQIDRKIEGKPFKYVSLFSGIGGFEQALNKLGGTCVLASEIDKFANQAYEVLYGHPTVGDVTKVEAEDVPDHDLLVGGFPCQAFSVAGKRGGFDDARGTLFFEVARIAAVKQPKLLLLENVKGLVGHDKGKTLDTIVQTLNQIGYHVDFNVLNSKYFGVPQNRERIFIVAIRDDLAVSEPWIIEGTNVVAKGKRRISGYDDVKTFNFDWPEQTEVTTRLRDILETDVDERYYLSEEKTAKLVAQLEEKTEGIAIKEATTKGYAVAAEGDAVNIQFPGSTTRRGRVGKQIAQTLEASGVNQGVVTPRYRIRKLTPLETFRLQGFPDSTHQALVDAGISNSQRYKMAGNAVTVNVIEAIGERLLPYLHRPYNAPSVPAESSANSKAYAPSTV